MEVIKHQCNHRALVNVFLFNIIHVHDDKFCLVSSKVFLGSEVFEFSYFDSYSLYP